MKTHRRLGCAALALGPILGIAPASAGPVSPAVLPTSSSSVTLPAIAPTLLLVSIISVAGFFQLFAEPYVMTQGGPAQSTVTVLYFMYEEGFKWWNLGSASAVAFVLFLCIFAVTMVQLWVSRRLGGEHT